MKILSSEMQFSSASQSSRTWEKTLHTLDENGNILRKEGETLREENQTSSMAYFSTNEDYTVEINHEAKLESNRNVEQQGEASVNLEDDFEKNLYMASILDWAADTIDQMVERFEDHNLTLLEEISSSLNVVEIRGQSLRQNSIESIKGNQESIYKSMASELRDKAAALRPEQMNPSDNRISRVSMHEIEKTTVQAAGIIQTADGREINFSLDVGMERENLYTSMETFRVVDPLVINFSGTSAELSDARIDFDLNGDGQTENIARLRKGSGYLALDLNKDGKVNSGKELFGPTMGDGFQALSLYDEDNNNWIDENDSVYEDLMVWIQEGSEGEVLKKLSETGIGAIHLKSVDSSFQLKDSNEQTIGQIASTGIALGEDGSVKTVQQVDLVV